MPITFLGFDEVLVVHRDQIARYGGSGCTSSRRAWQPLISFTSRRIIPLSTGTSAPPSRAPSAFLDANNYHLDVDHARAYEMVLSVARGEMQ